MARNRNPILDAYPSERVNEILATKPDEPITLPKPTPLEALQRWKVAAAASRSPAHQNAGVARCYDSRPSRRGSLYDRGRQPDYDEIEYEPGADA